MDTILLPLDGSHLSERALNLGQRLARAYGATLRLVHVLEEPLIFDLLPSLVLPDRQAAERYLAAVAEGVADDIDAHTSVLRGNATEELLALAQDKPETMIVMSTHGRGGLGRIVFGSVADKIVRGATVPVALVRAEPGPDHPTVHNILVPLDGSLLAEGALPVALGLARRAGATLSLVRVVEPFWQAPYVAFAPEVGYLPTDQVAEIEEHIQTEARTYLDRVAGELRNQGARVVWEVRIGRAADEITRLASTTNADLLVISTHGRGGVRRWALGSVTNEVLSRGVTPILTIPPMLRAQEQAEAAMLLSSAP
jgi:nucleotide-binding universal stress UspA family protein